MAEVGRRDLLLLMLGLGERPGKTAEGLGGITRLQKLMFLLEKEEHVAPETGNETGAFEFTAYKAGPYSSKLYDDLSFLENLGLVESEVVADMTEFEEAEAEEADTFSFEELMGTADIRSTRDDSDGAKTADSFEERRFRITDKGRRRIEEDLLRSGKVLQATLDGIRRIKSKYATYALSDLLYYVYTKYPDWTVESEIKDKVLRRGRAQ